MAQLQTHDVRELCNTDGTRDIKAGNFVHHWRDGRSFGTCVSRPPNDYEAQVLWSRQPRLDGPTPGYDTPDDYSLARRILYDGMTLTEVQSIDPSIESYEVYQASAQPIVRFKRYAPRVNVDGTEGTFGSRHR